MKFLHILPYSPVPPMFGGAIRSYYLLKNILRHHEVSVIAYGDADDYYKLKTEFPNKLNRVTMVPKNWSMPVRRAIQVYSHLTNRSFFYHLLRSRKMQDTIDRMLAEHEFDVVQVEFSQMGIFQLHTAATRILDSPNVEYDNFRRMWLNARTALRKFHYRREYQKFFREEIESVRKFDSIFVTSERDKQLYAEHLPAVPTWVVPNGVDTGYFKPAASSPEPDTMVFTGLMSYTPNDDGMLYFLDRVFPLIRAKIPSARIIIVGSQPTAALLRRASADVIVTGRVPDVRPYVGSAMVYVVPLRIGGGTRLKVTEALAMKRPIVTTSIGCEGIDVVDGETAMIRDTPESFADAVCELFRNEALRRRLVDAGHDLVCRRYDWEAIGEQQEAFYRALKGERRRVRRTDRTRMSPRIDAQHHE